MSAETGKKNRYSPIGIDNGALAAADNGIVPVPRLGVDGLADSAQDSDRADVVAVDMVGAETTEETDSGGCGVELGEAMGLDGLPVPGGGWVDRGGFEDGGGDTV